MTAPCKPPNALRFGHCVFNAGFVRHVRRYESSAVPKRLRQFLPGIVIDVAQDNLGAILDQQARRRRTQAGSAAADQVHLVGSSHCMSLASEDESRDIQDRFCGAVALRSSMVSD